MVSTGRMTGWFFSGFNPDSFGNNQKKLVSEFVKNYRLAKG
jgi:hypothetical protein